LPFNDRIAILYSEKENKDIVSEKMIPEEGVLVLNSHNLKNIINITKKIIPDYILFYSQQFTEEFFYEFKLLTVNPDLENTVFYFISSEDEISLFSKI